MFLKSHNLRLSKITIQSLALKFLNYKKVVCSSQVHMTNLCEKVNLEAPEDLIGKWFKSITFLRVHLHTYGTTQDPLLILGHALFISVLYIQHFLLYFINSRKVVDISVDSTVAYLWMLCIEWGDTYQKFKKNNPH